MTKHIVFVCVENAWRSQLAHALANMHGSSEIKAYSAGSRPSGKVNPKAIASMADKGYDLSSHQSSSLDSLPKLDFDAVVTMGCGDKCPMVKGKIKEDWGLPDPKMLPQAEFDLIRDDIEQRVLDLLKRLEA
jgi:protein-tyrosine-phosphatase